MKRLLYGKSYRPYYAAITENNFKKSNKQDLIMLHRILKKNSETWWTIRMWELLHIYGKDVRVILNIYRLQTAAIKLGTNMGPFQHFKQGAAKEEVLSPDLFKNKIYK